MRPMSTVAETLKAAARALAGSSESPRLDAEVLLCTVLGVTRTALIVQGSDPITRDALRAFQGLIDRRMDGVPVAYLTGRREFWSLPLKVTPAVLVPRPETETLVDLALALIAKTEERHVLDLGTGSGAVALAIASERPWARVTGVDVSAAALHVAQDNCRCLGLPNVTWRLGSWFEPVRGERFDVVVANPPYVAAGDPALETLVAEPALALISGPTGLEALEAIIAAAAAHLVPGGWLALEHGSDQARKVALLLERGGFRAVQSHEDHAGRPRVTLGTLHPPH
jgi:release factor glutamine methyltransferase